MSIAITRQVSPNFDQCELTHLERTPIDISLAQQQHAQYEAALAAQGFKVHSLSPDPEQPDSIFVEDVALVFDELAVITRPGAVSRRAETEPVSIALAQYRKIFSIKPPGILDGGDVLRLERRVFVGISSRTNEAAIRQLKKHLSPWDYEVYAVPVAGCLHLKSAVTQVGEKSLLINRDWVPSEYFSGWNFIDVAPEEPGAANALLLRDTVIFPDAFPRTHRLLESAGIKVIPVNVSEVLKAEGGVTCCSLLLK